MEMVKLFHPLTVGVNDKTGCRIWPEEYLWISKMNLFSYQGFFPTLEASKAALETVVFALLGYGIVLRHPIQVYVCDGQCGYLDEDECIPSIYRDDLPEKTVIIYSLLRL